jgi:hypothetical protein
METTMEKAFTLELIDWLHRLALEDEMRAQAEDEKRNSAPTNETKEVHHESRRIGFLWRADFARVIASAITLREVPSNGNWSYFRKRAGEDAAKRDRPLPSTGAAAV